jgi:hypothetical protein
LLLPRVKLYGITLLRGTENDFIPRATVWHNLS